MKSNKGEFSSATYNAFVHFVNHNFPIIRAETEINPLIVILIHRNPWKNTEPNNSKLVNDFTSKRRS